MRNITCHQSVWWQSKHKGCLLILISNTFTVLVLTKKPSPFKKFDMEKLYSTLNTCNGLIPCVDEKSALHLCLLLKKHTESQRIRLYSVNAIAVVLMCHSSLCKFARLPKYWTVQEHFTDIKKYSKT